MSYGLKSGYRMLFSTALNWELDMVIECLKENRIPYFGQEYGGGMVTGLSFQRTMGPGVSWSIQVPESHYEEAVELLSSLPIEIENNPGVFDFDSSPKRQSKWKFYHIVALGIAFGWVIIGLVNVIQGLMN